VAWRDAAGAGRAADQDQALVDRAQRGDDALATRRRAAAEVDLRGLAHEDEEAVRAHRVQAEDVAGRQHARLRQRLQEARELAHRLVVGGPAEVQLVAARAAEVEVDHVDGTRLGEERRHVAHDGG